MYPQERLDERLCEHSQVSKGNLLLLLRLLVTQLVPLQISRLVETFSTLITIEHRGITMNGLHVPLHVSLLGESFTTHLTGKLLLLRTKIPANCWVVFFVFVLHMPSQKDAESEGLLTKRARMRIFVILVVV